MDTFISADEDQERLEPSFRASLPPELRVAEEGDREEADAGAPDKAIRREVHDGSVPPWWLRRKLLLGSAAAVALFGIGGTLFLVSPSNRVSPVPKPASSAQSLTGQVGFAKPPVLAPAASLAGINAPIPPAEAVPKYVGPPRDEQLREVLGFHVGEPGAPVVPIPPGPSAATHTDPAAPEPGPAPDTGGGKGAPPDSTSPSPVAALSTAPRPNPPADATNPRSSSPAAQPTPAPPESPPPAIEDAVAKTLALQPAPMTPTQQVDVLQTVTRLAVLVRDQKTEVAALRADVTKANADYAARIDDFSRRLTLIEARKALTSAEQPVAADLPPASSGASSASFLVSKSAALAYLPGADEPASDSSGRRGYRIRAASPGLAMLAAVDRGGGDGAQLAVEVGDTLPGWGKVKSVSQSGTVWVVTTEHGTIRQ